jgi:hypothetical protein
MSDTPRTDAAIASANGQWSFDLRDIAQQLERELAKVKTDADALAEALQAACADPICGDWLGAADETLETYRSKYQ